MHSFVIEILDCPAIGYNITPETPAVTKQRAQEETSATGFSPQPLVSTHYGPDTGFLYHFFKMRRIGFVKIPFTGMNIGTVARGFRSAMHGKMFGCSHQFQVFRVIALQPFDILYSHFTGQIRIFAICLHTSSPPRVPENINVWCPIGQSLVNSPFILPEKIMVFCPGFVTYSRGNVKHHISVPHGSHSNGLGKNGGVTCTGDPVQALVPPVVFRHTQPVDGSGFMSHLRNFFLKSHS